MRAGACAVVLLLSVPPAMADPSGRNWLTLPSGYKVYNHTSINGVSDFQNVALPAVRSAFASWTKANVACTKWDSSFLGLFDSPGGRDAINGQDRQNRVIWLGGSDWTLDANTLGLTITTYRTSTLEILDADMEFNDNRVWKVGGPGARLDVQSIVTHEAGHYLGLDHTADPSAIMYASYTVGSIKTVLQAPDINDVCTVYPAPNPAGTQGAICTADSNCVSAAPLCRGPAGSSSALICTRGCSQSSDCPNGYECQPAVPTTGTGMACLAAAADAGAPPTGTLPPSAGQSVPPTSTGGCGCNADGSSSAWPLAVLLFAAMLRVPRLRRASGAGRRSR